MQHLWERNHIGTRSGVALRSPSLNVIQSHVTSRFCSANGAADLAFDLRLAHLTQVLKWSGAGTVPNSQSCSRCFDNCIAHHDGL